MNAYMLFIARGLSAAQADTAASGLLTADPYLTY